MLNLWDGIDAVSRVSKVYVGGELQGAPPLPFGAVLPPIDVDDTPPPTPANEPEPREPKGWRQVTPSTYIRVARAKWQRWHSAVSDYHSRQRGAFEPTAKLEFVILAAGLILWLLLSRRKPSRRLRLAPVAGRRARRRTPE